MGTVLLHLDGDDAVVLCALEKLDIGAVSGGFGEGGGADMRFGWPDAVVGHGTVEELEREFGFDAESIAEAIWRNSMA